MTSAPEGLVITMVVALIIGLFITLLFEDPHYGNILVHAATSIYEELTLARSGLGM